MKCKYAKATTNIPIPDGYGAHRIREHLRGNGIVVGLTSIKDHRAGVCMCHREAKPTAPVTAEPTLTGKADVTKDGGEFIDVQTTEPVTDWTHIFQRFNLDPQAFEVVGDTVRVSTWQQSKALEDGTRDIVNLFSYRASFRRITQAGPDTQDIINHLRAWTPTTRPATHAGPGLSYVVGLADLQLGKGEGDGTPGTLRRLNKALEGVTGHIEQLRGQGVNLQHLALVNLGDHTEGVQGSYASQTHTVDLNTRDQISLALEVNMQWIRTLVPMFHTATYAACMCNHGQLARGAGKTNVTDDADNATGLIGDTLKVVCNLHPDLSRIEWVIPRDEMITTFTASGLNIASAHGHKISGNEENWLAKQSQYLTQARRFIPELWFTAHKHHADVKDYGPYTRIQATTVDPGSKYFLDQSGMYSRPGVTTFVAGSQLPGGWEHYRIF
ncbi:hypothetical protein B0G38_002066 [Arthrobacter sp. VKM Ac-2550]|nr:hypothetical protein [Arthrobacter sp. VKM Ac-2550]